MLPRELETVFDWTRLLERSKM
ncbi:hypothetical protein NP493_842g01012 [Ridgeia piscesae]|uniref:Uncharacterized protein n=1 Tax=Ridgeia piscesae TaxID=27915 RepID=A0AAD9KM77_RIDPI|nr:hypothetical protein NP493_842g01012 [Ridgeia piscesae]